MSDISNQQAGLSEISNKRNCLPEKSSYMRPRVPEIKIFSPTRSLLD